MLPVTEQPAPATRVLLIEDEELYHHFMKRLLRQPSFGPVDLEVALNLADGLRTLAKGRPDVIITDLSLPDSEGLDTVRSVTEAAGRAPVVVLTIDGEDDTALASLEAGAQDFLVKGDFNAEQLARSIRHSRARAEAEERLRQTNDDLARTNRDLKEYASLVAHDLRAPVRTGRLLADRLSDAAVNRGDRAKVYELADRLDRCMDRLDSTVKRLLDYASLHDHGLTVRQIDAAAFLGGVIGDMQATLATVDPEPEIKIDADTDLYADLELLGLVLRELVSNAVKYRAPRRPLRLTLSCHQVGGTTQLAVADNGQGIEPDHRESVFQLFHRLHTMAEADGLGFGLTYSRRIIDMHGGTITIGDGPNRTGTTVHITLPAPVSTLSAGTGGEGGPYDL